MAFRTHSYPSKGNTEMSEVVRGHNNYTLHIYIISTALCSVKTVLAVVTSQHNILNHNLLSMIVCALHWDAS